ncbi:MAG: hypothetical protein ACLQVJ_14705 [Syntrophobacteraceae bacterium]
MKRHKFEIIFGAVLVGLFLCFWFWHSPVTGKLTQEEINHYLAAIEKNAFPPAEKTETLARLRAWAEMDDGKSVYMINLLRNYDQLHHYAGTPDFQGTPEQSNKIYEEKAVPFLIMRGSYPMFIGRPQGKNILGFEPALNDWSEVLLVRYRDRRAFLSLVADPQYAPIMPYKLMATQINLIPNTASALIPDMRLIIGGTFLLLFLAVGWIRAARLRRQ